MERGAFFTSLDTLMFTASPNSTASPPASPYELFRMNFSTGKQIKLAIDVSSGGPSPVGVYGIKRIPNHNKLAFIVDRGTTSPDEIWIYNLGNESMTKISHASVNSTAGGAKEFRVSDDGTHLVFVGDMQNYGHFELYSVAIPTGDSYSAPTKISHASLASPGIKNCINCGDGEKFYFKISPGSSNKYVVYSGIQGLPDRYDLHIASMNGASILGAQIHGAGTTNIDSGTKISSTEISADVDFADHVGFSFDGSHLLYHVQVAGPVDKIYQLDVTYVAGTSLIVPVPTLILASNAKYPFFKMGKTTQRAVYTSNPGGSTHTIHTLDLTNSANNFALFDVPASPGSVSQLELIDNDTKVVAAISNASDVIEVRSSNAIVAANWDTGNGGSAPNGTSVSYTGGVLTGGKKVAPLSPGGGGGGRSFLVTSDSSKILLNTDMVTIGISRLYYFTVGNATPTPISGAGVVNAATSVTSFALSATDIPYFTAAIDVATKPELYETQLSGSPTVVRRNAGSGLDKITSLGAGDDEDEDFPDLVIADGNPVGATSVKEAWAFNPTTFEYIRMSKLSGDTFGAGRFRLRMLESTDGLNFQTAHSSDCLKLNSPQSDGEQIVSSVRIPLGNGSASSPFAAAVDVYPLATSCSGTVETHLFPNGLGTATSCSAGAGACILGSYPNLVLFLRDQ